MTSDAWHLTPLEIAAGFPIGLDPSTPPLPEAGEGDDPVVALERAVLVGLSRPPCLVSFSGGRDSSAVLAVATDVARREGLPLPVPMTLLFPRAPEADEADWQAGVIEHLGLDEWIRLEFDDDLDLVGPVAAGVLRRHGLVWPPNSHFHVPILERARGGSVLTGIDGDGLFANWRWARVAGVLGRQLRPEPRDVLRIGLALSPRPVRSLHARRSADAPLPWLTPEAARRLARAWAGPAAAEPLRWDRRVKWWVGLRSLRMVVRTFSLLAADADVAAVHPLADPGFLAALARAGGWWGLGNRTAIMRSLFAGVLLDEVLARPTKARLDGPTWNRHSRAFVAAWDGEGLDETLVDPAALRRAWSNGTPHAAGSTLLQALWLRADAARSAGEKLHQPIDDPG